MFFMTARSVAFDGDPLVTAPSKKVPAELLLLSPPTPRTIPPAFPHVLPDGMLPSKAVVRSEAVLMSAIRRAYFPTGVCRTPMANCTFSDGLLLLVLPVPEAEPPAQTPPSKSPMN